MNTYCQNNNCENDASCKVYGVAMDEGIGRNVHERNIRNVEDNVFVVHRTVTSIPNNVHERSSRNAVDNITVVHRKTQTTVHPIMDHVNAWTRRAQRNDAVKNGAPPQQSTAATGTIRNNHPDVVPLHNRNAKWSNEEADEIIQGATGAIMKGKAKDCDVVYSISTAPLVDVVGNARHRAMDNKDVVLNIPNVPLMHVASNAFIHCHAIDLATHKRSRNQKRNIREHLLPEQQLRKRCELQSLWRGNG